MSAPFPRPTAGEHAQYFARYIGLVPDGDVLDTLQEQLGETLALLQDVPPALETHRYAPGKWSIREVIGHLLDTERVMAFRALAMARTDSVDLPGMDPDTWMALSNAHHRTLDDLAAEWAGVRRATMHMFATLPEEVLTRRGKASGNEFTVRTFPWIIAGHELWHRERLAKDYLTR